jgi:predicted MFS family arabinose efflux permease
MMIGDVAGPDRMSSAMSFDAVSNNASRIVGPMLGGLLLAHYGIAAAFWLSVALYTASAVAAFQMRVRTGSGTAHSGSFFRSIREGLAWLRRDRRMIGVFTITVIFNLFAWPFTSMIPVIGTDYLHLGPKGVGLLASFEGIGGLIGAIIVATLARPDWYGRIYVGAVSLYLVAVVGFATAPVAPVAALSLFMAGLVGAGFAVMQATLVYRAAPVEMRARLLGVLSVCIGAGPIGFLYLGFLAEMLTPRVAVVALSAQGMLAMLLTRRYWAVALRSPENPVSR